MTDYFLFFSQDANFPVKAMFVPIALMDDQTKAEMELLLSRGEYIIEEYTQITPTVFQQTDKYSNIKTVLLRWDDMADDSPTSLERAFPDTETYIDYKLMPEWKSYSYNPSEFEEQKVDSIKIPQYYQQAIIFYEPLSGPDDINKKYDELKNKKEHNGKPINIVSSVFYKS